VLGAIACAALDSDDAADGTIAVQKCTRRSAIGR
jgi:hypothetical protein